MCQLHEIRATYSECKMLGEGGSLSFIKQYNLFSNSQPHLLIRQDIYLCGDASKDKSNPTCGTLNSFMSDDKVAEVGASRVTGKCPVCEAAERAVEETSLQVVYHKSNAPKSSSERRSSGNGEGSGSKGKKSSSGEHRNKKK